MNRRQFLPMLVGGVAMAAAVRSFPFRVFSFPAKVVLPVVDPPSEKQIRFLADSAAFRIGHEVALYNPDGYIRGHLRVVEINTKKKLVTLSPLEPFIPRRQT